MSYTPTVWQTGDTITATKLNKAEQGIAGATNHAVYNFMDFVSGDDPMHPIVDFDSAMELYMAGAMFYFEPTKADGVTIAWLYRVNPVQELSAGKFTFTSISVDSAGVT